LQLYRNVRLGGFGVVWNWAVAHEAAKKTAKSLERNNMLDEFGLLKTRGMRARQSGVEPRWVMSSCLCTSGHDPMVTVGRKKASRQLLVWFIAKNSWRRNQCRSEARRLCPPPWSRCSMVRLSDAGASPRSGSAQPYCDLIEPHLG